MAGKIPVMGLPQAKGDPGAPANPGYSGGYGTTIGAATGSLFSPVGTAVGTVLGAIVDAVIGHTTANPGRAAKPPKPRPVFAPPEPYKAQQSQRLRDPGAAGGMQMGQNVRLAAANNVKNRLQQQAYGGV